jgi:hypothetical protein
MRGFWCSVAYATVVIMLIPIWLPIAFVADLIGGDQSKYNVKIQTKDET